LRFGGSGVLSAFADADFAPFLPDALLSAFPFEGFLLAAISVALIRRFRGPAYHRARRFVHKHFK
jgi:hypothetical protein